MKTNLVDDKYIPYTKIIPINCFGLGKELEEHG